MMRARLSFGLACVAIAAATALPACTTYRDDLARSERAFEENQHERALAILRMLEPDLHHLDEPQRARYAYLRGMTDYRVGYKADARHWLAVAKAMDEKTPGSLPQDWRTRLDQSLTELDQVVYQDGIEALTNAKPRAPKAKPESDSDEPRAKPKSDEDEESEKPAPKKKKPIDDEE
jgi:hypothetical protein